MKRILLSASIALLLLLPACSDNSGAVALLEGQGFTDVRPTGHSFWGCGEGDNVATGFSATSPSGKPVKGVICGGLLFKGATIRFF